MLSAQLASRPDPRRPASGARGSMHAARLRRCSSCWASGALLPWYDVGPCSCQRSTDTPGPGWPRLVWSDPSVWLAWPRCMWPVVRWVGVGWLSLLRRGRGLAVPGLCVFQGRPATTGRPAAQKPLPQDGHLHAWRLARRARQPSLRRWRGVPVQ